MASAHVIELEARSLHLNIPSLTTGQHASPRVRDNLENLARMAGLTQGACDKANDNDLISIFLVALKDGGAAQRTAQKIELRLDDSLSGTPGSAHAKPRWPKEPFTPAPLPEPPAPPQGEPLPGLDAIRALIKREVREGALDPLQAALTAMDAEWRLELGDSLAASAKEALELMRAAMKQEAHAAAAEALKSIAPTRLDVSLHNATPVPLGLVHKDTAKIITALSAGVNVYLHGPAGSGKTTVAIKCAQAFGVQFYTAAKVESEYQLIGFKDARGETVRTQFRDAYERGGVFLFDEMDGSAPSAVVAMNMALANRVCAFPDGIVARHADFYCIGAGNTKLTGATRQYVGRNQLDAASVDRFAFIEFGYDDELERALATDPTWCGYVQAVRAAIAERGLNHLVTPRATYDGCLLLAKGMDWDTVASMMIYKGLDLDTVKQIENALDYSKAA